MNKWFVFSLLALGVLMGFFISISWIGHGFGYATLPSMDLPEATITPPIFLAGLYLAALVVLGAITYKLWCTTTA